jgi:glutamate-1-semialdehyde 2,1-aminomutase
LVLPFNDEATLIEAFTKHGDRIAAVITEPVIGNSGCILPRAGFLEFLREICSANSALLIFDEVMTGFRVALGGAQELYGVMPDITTLGKIIGGGLPVGAYGASRAIMSMVAPSGPMYQAGTLSGNPLAMSAGLTCLRKIQAQGFYEELNAKTKYLVNGLRAANQESDIPEIRDMQLVSVGAMFGMAFTTQAVYNYEDAKTQNLDLFRKYYLAMLDQGVYLAPSAFEAGFVSAAHSYEDLDATINAHKQVIAKI